jgi:hypothetical protein
MAEDKPVVSPASLPQTPVEVKTPPVVRTGEGSVLVDSYRRPDSREISLLEYRSGSGAVLKFDVTCSDMVGKISWTKEFYQRSKALEEYEKWRT